MSGTPSTAAAAGGRRIHPGQRRAPHPGGSSCRPATPAHPGRSHPQSVPVARPVSTACHCPGVSRRARPAAVVEDNPGTGASCCPAASARCRSRPTRKSSPASCAATIPASGSPGPEAANPLLDRAHRRIQRPDYAQPVTQLADRHKPRIRRQPPIQRADPRLLTPHAASTYADHQIGVLSAGLVLTWQRSSSQARAAPVGIYRAASPSYSRNRD